MTKITLDVIRKIYPLARDVYEKRLNITDVQSKLIKDMNPGSARDYVRAFLHMMKGECYKRSINKDAVRHFLEMIHSDFGQQALRTALSSVKEHTKWYAGLRSERLLSIENIHKEFLKRVS